MNKLLIFGIVALVVTGVGVSATNLKDYSFLDHYNSENPCYGLTLLYYQNGSVIRPVGLTSQEWEVLKNIPQTKCYPQSD